jgi:3'(2'), 5'-bisphosphate nucleotidase
MLHDMVAQTITKRAADTALAGDAPKRTRDARAQVLDLFLRAALAGAKAIQTAGLGLISFKDDGTPHAAADLASDLAIRAVLAARPDLPIISEEGARELPQGFAERPFILVDPLDGTREFMEGHPDHAVCIALVEARRPVAGVIVAPAQRLAWLAGDQAVELTLDESLDPLPGGRLLTLDGEATTPPLSMATSRSRPDPLARRLFPEIDESGLRHIGAVLKLVSVARGEACIFPTQNPSSEWDIAAGDALIAAAGGTMIGRDGRPLLYGRAEAGFLHEPYVAARSRALADLALRRWAGI